MQAQIHKPTQTGKFLTCNEELLCEGAGVKCRNLLLQAHSQNAEERRERERDAFLE